MTSTPPDTLEEHIANPSEFEEEESYSGDTVEVLIERYRKLTVIELKSSLRQVGIKPRGLKKDLVRLLAEKEYQRLYSNWESRREELIRKREQERIERIRDENHQLKETVSENKTTVLLSPLKSPISVRLILTPRKMGAKAAAKESASSSAQQALKDVSAEESVQCMKGVHTPVKRDRAHDGMDEVSRKKAASGEPNQTAVKVESSGVKVESSGVKVEVSSPVKAEPSSVIKAEVSSPVKAEPSSVIKAEVSSPVKAEASSGVRVETTSPAKPEVSPVKAETISPAKIVASSAVKVEVPPVKPETNSPVKSETPLVKPETKSPVKVEASPPATAEANAPLKTKAPSPVKIESSANPPASATAQPSPAKETIRQETTPSIPHSEPLPPPLRPGLPNATPSKLPSTKPLVSISNTPLRDISVLQTSSSLVKDAESSGSRGSGNESIQAKTQLLLQRVEGMKKRKEERLQHSVLMTPGKPTDSKMRPLTSSRGLAKLSSRRGGITIDEDLSMPALPTMADPMERSFISIVSSPAAQRKHVPSASQDVKKQKEEPPKRTIPIGARRVPIQKAPSEVQKPATDVPKPQADTPTLQHGVTKPQPSQLGVSKPQHETAKPQPSQPDVLKPQHETPSSDTNKKRALPTQDKTEPESKRSAVEPPRLPSNRSRSSSAAPPTASEPVPNLEMLRQLVDSERIDPTKRWYEEGNISILLRKQYYESFTNGVTADLVFAQSEEMNLEQVIPNAPANHYARRPSDVWN